MNDTNDKQWNVARQKAKSTIGEAFRLMTVNGEIDKTLSTEDFVKNVVSKYLKISKFCGEGKQAAKDCGFASSIKAADGSNIKLDNFPMSWGDNRVVDPQNMVTTGGSYSGTTTYSAVYPGHDNSYFFQTLYGFSVNFFYNPYCVHDMNERPYRIYTYSVNLTMDVICFNAVYDMNGAKGPNRVGKDIGFVGSFYNSYSTKSEAVLPYEKAVDVSDLGDGTDKFLLASNYCNNIDKENGWILPSLDEASLLYLNKDLLGDSISQLQNAFFTRTIFTQSQITDDFWFIYLSNGQRRWFNRERSYGEYAYCVRNTPLK